MHLDWLQSRNPSLQVRQTGAPLEPFPQASPEQQKYSPSAHQVKTGDSHSEREVRSQSRQVFTSALWFLPDPGACRPLLSQLQQFPSSREGCWIRAHPLLLVPETRLLNLPPEYRKLFCSLLLIASRTVSYLSSLQNFSDTFQGRLQPLHLQPLVCLGCRWSADGSNWLHGYR